MFGKLKDKLKSALSVFSSKAEKEAEVTEVEVEVPVEEKKTVSVPEKNVKAASSKKIVDERKETTQGKKKEKKEEKREVEIKKVVEVVTEKSTSEKKKVKVEPAPVVEKKVIIEEKKEIVSEKKEEEKEEKKGFFGRLFSRKKGEETKEEPVNETEEVKEEKVKDKVKPVSKESKNEKQKEEKTEIIKQEAVTEVEETEIIDNVEEIEEEKEAEEIIEEPKKRFFGKLKQSFTTKTISGEKFEELFWDLELVLLESNVSVEVIERIKLDLRRELVDKPLPRDVMGKIEETLKRTLKEILSVEKVNLLEKIKEKGKKPFVIAFFGINGAGKTTSIAKLTHYLQKNKLSVVLAACDTFRAAAIQQLEEHAVKLGVKIIKQDYGSDAAAVAFDAIKYAEKNSVDVVLIDTAGRLHSNTNLMSELKKIIRVTNPDLKLFVGESITGNDCIEQARKFNELVEMDGAILTKADVDDKGGAPLSISYTIKKPILFLGVGQTYDDFEEFNADVMVKRLGF